MRPRTPAHSNNQGQAPASSHGARPSSRARGGEVSRSRRPLRHQRCVADGYACESPRLDATTVPISQNSTEAHAIRMAPGDAKTMRGPASTAPAAANAPVGRSSPPHGQKAYCAAVSVAHRSRRLRTSAIDRRRLAPTPSPARSRSSTESGCAGAAAALFPRGRAGGQEGTAGRGLLLDERRRTAPTLRRCARRSSRARAAARSPRRASCAGRKRVARLCRPSTAAGAGARHYDSGMSASAPDTLVSILGEQESPRPLVGAAGVRTERNSAGAAAAYLPSA